MFFLFKPSSKALQDYNDDDNNEWWIKIFSLTYKLKPIYYHSGSNVCQRR